MSSKRDLNRRDALKRMAGLGLGATVPSLLVNCGDDDSNTGSSRTRCTNTCEFSYDDECDDGGPESLYSFCALGTDCGDCGPRGGGGYSSGGYSSGGYSSGAYSSSSYSSSSYSSSYSSQYCSGYGSLYYYSYRCSS
jgi:hypothetical protein